MLAAEEGSREAELPGKRSRERSGPACLWRFPAGAGGRRCCPATAAAGRSRRRGGHAGAVGRQMSWPGSQGGKRTYVRRTRRTGASRGRGRCRRGVAWLKAAAVDLWPAAPDSEEEGAGCAEDQRGREGR